MPSRRACPGVAAFRGASALALILIDAAAAAANFNGATLAGLLAELSREMEEDRSSSLSLSPSHSLPDGTLHVCEHCSLSHMFLKGPLAHGMAREGLKVHCIVILGLLFLIDAICAIRPHSNSHSALKCSTTIIAL